MATVSTTACQCCLRFHSPDNLASPRRIGNNRELKDAMGLVTPNKWLPCLLQCEWISKISGKHSMRNI